jgi:hypothetical protein
MVVYRAKDRVYDSFALILDGVGDESLKNLAGEGGGGEHISPDGAHIASVYGDRKGGTAKSVGHFTTIPDAST